MYLTRIRLKPENDYSSLYHGKVHLCPVSMQEIEVLEHAALWYMEFVKSSSETQYSQYFGVLDFDIAKTMEMSDQQYTELKNQTLEVINSLLEDKFPHYQIYSSGKKGFHVYIYDLRCWLIPADPQCNRGTWIRSQLRTLFGDALFDMLDLSNHNIGKGIRPYMCRHPSTNVMPFVVKQTPDCPDMFWEWFMEQLFLGASPIATHAIYEPATTPALTSAPTATSPEIVRSESKLTLKQKLEALYKHAADFQRKEKNLYIIQNTKYCCFIQGDHKSQKNYVYMYPDHIYITCHSGKCHNNSKYLTADYTPLTDFGLLIDRHCNEFNKPQRRKIIKADVPYILKEDIEWCLQDPGFGAVFAPMGSGKTKALEDWIDCQRKDFTYLLIVVRQSQASYFSHRYKDLVDYQSVRTNLYGTPRLVICINSLVRLLAPDGSFPHYDLLMLDEIESIVEGSVSKILSSGRTEQCSIWNILGTLIKSSGKVLIMDGIPTYHTIKYFTGLGLFKEFSIVEHHRQPDFRIYKCYSHKQEFLDQIQTDLQNNKNVVLVTNTKEIQTLVYSQIVCDSKMMINADSEKKIKNTSKKPNEKWNVRFLAYNNAVGAGASFDLNHFHVMYAVVSPLSCFPQSFYQLICRIRKLQDSQVNLLVISNDYLPVPTKEELKLSKIKNIAGFHNIQNEYRPRLSILQVPVAAQIVQPVHRANLNPLITAARRDPNSILNLLEAGVLPGPTYPARPVPVAVPHVINPAPKDTMFSYSETENFRLDICELDYKVIRVLSAQKHLKLKHEDDFFLDTLIDYEHEKLILRDSDEYSKQFFTMIRRNGGVVIEINEDKKELLKTSSRMIKTDARKFFEDQGVHAKNVFWNPPPDFNPVKAKIWNKLVNFNDVNKQYRWLSLRNRLIQDKLQVYEKEFTLVNSKHRAISNCMLFSIGVLESFELLSVVCGFEIDKQLGLFKGQPSILNFHSNANQIMGCVQNIYEQLYNETQIKYEVTLPDPGIGLSAINLAIWKNLKRLFECFGINCNYMPSGGRRRQVNGARLVDSRFGFCMETQHVRMALAGLAFDTGDKIPDAVQYYMEKNK